MHQNKQMQQQDKHQLITRDSKSLSSSTTTIRLSHFLERLQKKTYKDRRHHRSHHHKRYNRQNYKARRYFPRCGLGFLIFLSAIKVSFATVYSTSYLLSLDVTTAVPQTHFLPYFDFDVPRNITVTVGQTGFLHCRVERLGDKDVSWIRKRDLHILTAGSTTYTSDQRFQVLRPDNSGNLTLQIKYPQPRDSGIYECQINTEPKMSLSYTFNVVELKATIVGPTDLYVKSGSDINLTCRIIQGPHELGNIFWYKGSEIIEMATNQNEIDSGTRITVDNDWSDGLTSRLKIRRASSSDTGNYTCVPTIAKSSSVYVHVIIGEHPAAMQHNASTAHCGSFYINLGCMLVAILTCFLEHLLCTNTNNSGMTKTTSQTTTLATKGASTSAPSLIIANATGTATTTVQSASVSASTSKTKARQRNISAVTKVLPSKPFCLSLDLCTKSKQFPKPTLKNFSTTTSLAASVTSTYCKRRTSFFASDRNFR